MKKIIKNFKDFKQYYSVGITFIYNNKILLVHSSRTSENIWSYPKGHPEINETLKETAIREVNEELSLKLPIDFLINQKPQIAYKKLKLRGLKTYIYFKYYLNVFEFSKYFDSKYNIDKQKLQLEEIDQAKFFTKKDAIKLIGNLKKILEY